MEGGSDIFANQRSSSPCLTTLMVACQQGLEFEVRGILKKKPVLVTSRDRSGKTALHYCVENNNVSCAELILDAHPSLLDAQDLEGYSALHLAVISGNKVMTRYLIKKGSQVNSFDNEKHSCVHWATVCGELDCLDMLFEAGANPSTADIHGAFPIHYAAQMCGPNSEMGNDVRVGLAVLRRLLGRGVDVNCQDQDGRPPLLWAASAETRASKTYCPSGSSDAILALVNAGADVCSEDKDGLRAVHCAASRGHLECLETLITLCGAEVDVVDSNGCSPLFYAVTLGHADCTDLLLKFGANANRQDRKGRTAAHCGASKGQLETLKILAQSGANMWLRNVRGDLPLHEAVQSSRKDLVHWLLEQQPCAINMSNTAGRTALHIAALMNNVEMCKVLMDNGAYVNPVMKNSKGQLMTPLDAALHRGNRGCAKYLQLHGALPASKLLEKKGEIAGTFIFTMDEEEEKGARMIETFFDNLQYTVEEEDRNISECAVQTEVQGSERRDVDIQVHLPNGDSGSRADHGLNEHILKEIEKDLYGNAKKSKGKPIIAEVYVHAMNGEQEKTSAGDDVKNEPSKSYIDSKQSEKIQRANNKELHLRLRQPREKTEALQQRSDAKKAVLIKVPSEGSTGHITNGKVAHPDWKGKKYIVLQNAINDENEPHGSEKNLEEEETQLRIVRRKGAQGQFAGYKWKLKSSQPEPENSHSPLSSIRSIESNVTTLKDSGFSDDLERDAGDETSEDDVEEKLNKRRFFSKKQLPSVFENDRESRAFHQHERQNNQEVMALRQIQYMAPEDKRILSRPTLSQEVQKSIRRYTLERRIFQELQDLKRQQLRSGKEQEHEVVRKLVERFRKRSLVPGMKDYYGVYTFKAFEKYLYEQLRQLSSTAVKIRKPKVLEPKYLQGAADAADNPALCVCRTYRCHHATEAYTGHKRQLSQKSPVSNQNMLPSIPQIPAIEAPLSRKHSAEDAVSVARSEPVVDLKTSTVRHRKSKIPLFQNSRSLSWERLRDDEHPHPHNSMATSLPSLTHNHHRANSETTYHPPVDLESKNQKSRIPTAVLATIGQELDKDVDPSDTIVIEMASEDDSSKYKQTFTVKEVLDASANYEDNQAILSIDDTDPVTFEIRHGREKNIFRLPAGRLKGNKKCQRNKIHDQDKKTTVIHDCLWPRVMNKQL